MICFSITENMISIVRSKVVDLPTKLSLSYFWCGGFMISSFLIIQVLSGIILSLLYVANSFLSFACVLDLTTESLFIWFVRYFHI